MTQNDAPKILSVDSLGRGHTDDGRVYAPVSAGHGVRQSGPYSVIISYRVPDDPTDDGAHAAESPDKR